MEYDEMQCHCLQIWNAMSSFVIKFRLTVRLHLKNQCLKKTLLTVKDKFVCDHFF